MSKIKSCSVQEALDALKKNNTAVMIDVREPNEVAEIATAMGVCYPMSQINPETFADERKLKKDQAIYLLCRSGGRSMRVAEALAQCGFTNLTNVTGGITAWQAQGLPLKNR